MANPEHLEILKKGVEKWNQWRKDNPGISPDLHSAYLDKWDLRQVNFNNTDLRKARLSLANLYLATLAEADLSEADLQATDFRESILWRADLTKSYLGGAIFDRTILHEANFRESTINTTTFSDCDLRSIKGLESVIFGGPSTIGVNTIFRSQGKIPKAFLLGCGVPEQFIAFIPSLIGAVEPFQYHSCFISYSTKDEDFAKRLHSRLRDAKVRVWFAPEDIKGGVKLYDQIERAIQIHDRLLVVLSEHSLQSEWVMTEIRKAREVEKRENRRKLFPIRLADFDQIKKWRCPDADSGKDLAVEVREYFIPDFSNWKDHDSFEKAFERLLRDLREAEDAKEGA